MRKIYSAVLCALILSATASFAHPPNAEPIHAAAGTVLTFYLQTRLNPVSVSPLDALPKGTLLQVRLLDSIDSGVAHDGASFRAVLVAPLTAANNEIIVHADAEVRGLFVLLRSRNHPEGFRYELLLTGITENGKSLDLTASLNPSLSDTPKVQPAAGVQSLPKVPASVAPRTPDQANQ